MPSLKQLKQLEAQPSLFDVPLSNEDAYEVADEPSISQPAVDWYVPKKSWQQFFAERESGIMTDGWDEQIKELEKFYDRKLPATIRLNSWTLINDVKEFVSSHLAVVKTYNGNKRFEPYLERLNELKMIINANL